MTKHNKSNTKEYSLWQRIKKSCYTPSYGQYKNYGAKGVILCKEWEEDFLNFLADIEEIPNGYRGLALLNSEIKVFRKDNITWTHDNRGRPRKLDCMKDFHNSPRKLKNSARLYLTLDGEQFKKLKSAAYEKSISEKRVVGVNDYIRDLISINVG